MLNNKKIDDMENIEVIELENGFYKLIPFEGYILYNTKIKTYHVEAVTKNVNEFIAVRHEEVI